MFGHEQTLVRGCGTLCCFANAIKVDENDGEIERFSRIRVACSDFYRLFGDRDSVPVTKL